MIGIYSHSMYFITSFLLKSQIQCPLINMDAWHGVTPHWTYDVKYIYCAYSLLDWDGANLFSCRNHELLHFIAVMTNEFDSVAAKQALNTWTCDKLSLQLSVGHFQGKHYFLFAVQFIFHICLKPRLHYRTSCIQLVIWNFLFHIPFRATQYNLMYISL